MHKPSALSFSAGGVITTDRVILAGQVALKVQCFRGSQGDPSVSCHTHSSFSTLPLCQNELIIDNSDYSYMRSELNVFFSVLQQSQSSTQWQLIFSSLVSSNIVSVESDFQIDTLLKSPGL